MKKERPILFSTPMVQAILAAIKTVTRRTNGLEAVNENPDQWKFDDYETGFDCTCKSCDKLRKINKRVAVFENKEGDRKTLVCPYGKPGDILWVRETWGLEIGMVDPIDTVSYKADSFHRSIWNEDGFQLPNFYSLPAECEWFDEAYAAEVKWKPNIHMFKHFARIWLEITDIRVERLQDISEADAEAEGVLRFTVSKGMTVYQDYLKKISPGRGFLFATGSFISLWKSINGPSSWDLNPWVWVVSFKRIEKPGGAA